MAKETTDKTIPKVKPNCMADFEEEGALIVFVLIKTNIKKGIKL